MDKFTVIILILLSMTVTYIFSSRKKRSDNDGGRGDYENDYGNENDNDYETNMVIPINQRTRGAIGTWKTIGILHSESFEDDTIFNLDARIIDRGRDQYEYRITNNETGVTIELFGGDEVGELEDGETVTIPGYESVGVFVVLKNSPDELKYLPYF